MMMGMTMMRRRMMMMMATARGGLSLPLSPTRSRVGMQMLRNKTKNSV
jgi:hypothetical protein